MDFVVIGTTTGRVVCDDAAISDTLLVGCIHRRNWSHPKIYQGRTHRGERPKKTYIRIKRVTSTYLLRFRLPSCTPLWTRRFRAYVSWECSVASIGRYHNHERERTRFRSGYDLEADVLGGSQVLLPLLLRGY